MKICYDCSHRFAGKGWQCPACGWAAPVHDGIHVLTPSELDGASGFEAAFFDDLDRAESLHFWFRGRLALIALVLDQFFPKATTFLDVGSGTGHVVSGLQRHRPSMRFTAAEAFESGLRLTAKRTPNVELVQADALRLPYEHEFDVVGAFDVIEHIADDGAVLRELTRAVRPGGGIVITVPQHRFLWSPFDERAHHHRRYSRRQLSELVKKAGCDVIFVTSFVSLLLPAMLAARLFRRAYPDDALAEFRVSGAVNAVGRTAMWVERRLIDWGLSFPAGGSLLIVARAL